MLDNLCKSYACPPVRGYNPRALASGLSYVQVDIDGITILYHLHMCNLAHHEAFRAKDGKGGTKRHSKGNEFFIPYLLRFRCFISVLFFVILSSLKPSFIFSN